MPRVACYARISRDPAEQRIGVDGQQRDLAAYAASRWPEAEVVHFDDNDLTAADPDVERPGYAALLDEIRAGEVVAVVAVEQSRITRQPSQWEEFCTVATRAGLAELHTLSAGTVSVAPSNRLLGRILAAVDAEEVERVRVRTLRSHERLAAEGRPSGGRPYGYQVARDADGRSTLVPDPDEAEVVRRMVRWTIEGMSASAIADRLDAEGVPRPRGGKLWRRTSVRSIIETPSIAGLRARHGVVVGEAVWPGIVSVREWEAVQAILAAPARWRTASGSIATTSRKRSGSQHPYLLSGLIFCGVEGCGWRLRGNRQARRKGGTVPSYACKAVASEARLERPPCGGVSISAEPLDADIADALRGAAADGELVRRLSGVDEGERTALAAEVAAAGATLSDIASAWGAGALSTEEWQVARSGALRRSQEARQRLAALGGGEGVDVEAVASSWESMTLGHRRRVAAFFIERVTVLPMRLARERGVDRVLVEWRN